MIFWVWVLERTSSYANKQLGWVVRCSSPASILPFLSNSPVPFYHQTSFNQHFLSLHPPSCRFLSPLPLHPTSVHSPLHSLSYPLWCWPCVNGTEWWVGMKLHAVNTHTHIETDVCVFVEDLHKGGWVTLRLTHGTLVGDCILVNTTQIHTHTLI